MALADQLLTRALTAGTTMLKNHSQWYVPGTFRNPLSDAWTYSTSGPAALCASMARAGAAGSYQQICTECFDFAIDNMSAPGYYIDPYSTIAGTESLERMLFCANLGWSMFVLGDKLDAAHKLKWLNALKNNVERLESTGDMVWYQNGNWECTKLRFLWPMMVVCKSIGDITGYHRFATMYERAYTMLTAPNTAPAPGFPAGDPKWNGYGLIVDVTGGWNDWSDYLAHLVEVNAGPPMPNGGAGTSWNGSPPYGTYDGDYTGLQLEHLTCWYVMTREQRALRILNAVTNKYMDPATTNQTTWIGNFSGGSRHNNSGNGIYTPALAVLALLGERVITGTLAAPFTDAKVLSEWDVMLAPAMTQTPLGNVPIGVARSWGSVVGSILYACEQAKQRL
jgi:hypothetical protein